MTEEQRLIEVAFPLKQTSLDSVHEKNVRHGHISTLHIWPARRPLAASRAALIATLLPDPGNDEERKQMLERLGGRLVTRVKAKKLPDGRIEEQTSEETEGGILHWGRESSADLDWFREKIRTAYGGRAPRVLDPFAGGGAIPLEAMRLGCDVTAVDINPVAWFILKCTLEYPQRLANQVRPLPEFACQSAEFMEQYFKAKGFKGAALRVQLASLGFQDRNVSSQPTLTGIKVDVASVEADLAWHVRAWGWWSSNRQRLTSNASTPQWMANPPSPTSGRAPSSARTAAPPCRCSKRAGCARKIKNELSSPCSRTPKKRASSLAYRKMCHTPKAQLPSVAKLKSASALVPCPVPASPVPAAAPL